MKYIQNADKERFAVSPTHLTLKGEHRVSRVEIRKHVVAVNNELANPTHDFEDIEIALVAVEYWAYFDEIGESADGAWDKTAYTLTVNHDNHSVSVGCHCFSLDTWRKVAKWATTPQKRTTQVPRKKRK